MCGIIVSNRELIPKILKEQKFRGLDSVGIVTYNNIYKATRKNLESYEQWFNKSVKQEKGLFICHHRKATIGDINLDNSHPFDGEKFLLMQNGTAKNFHKESKHKEEVDSHNLLLYIEERADKLEDVPAVMLEFKEEFKDDYGILLLIDGAGRVLFISDGARESFISIRKKKVKTITNYETDKVEGYKNEGYIIFSLDGKIISKEFKNQLNTVEFKAKPIVYNYGLYGYKPLLPAQVGQIKLPVSVSLKESEFRDEACSWLYTNTFHLVDLPYPKVLERFLFDIYGVKTILSYYQLYKEVFPAGWFFDEWREVFGN